MAGMSTTAMDMSRLLSVPEPRAGSPGDKSGGRGTRTASEYRLPVQMAVTTFQDLPLADRDREWDGDAAEKRVRAWAGADDEPNAKYRDAHVWYDADEKDEFGAYKLLIADVVDGKLKAVPRAVIQAAAIMQGARGGIDLPKNDIDRVKSHLAKYYAKMDDTAPWDE